MSASSASWIAVDWGTSNLRAWVIAADGTVIASHGSDKGMGTLDPAGFEPALLELVAPYLPVSGRLPVIACGMVGARQGWIEAPYACVPCPPPGVTDAERAPSVDLRLDVRILPGVSQAAPPDVMRGEETQIAGYLRSNPDFSGVLCLPGTHSKWVLIEDRAIAGFRTFMTGELFSLLSKQSVLRHSMGGDGWDDAAFLAAAAEAVEEPGALATQLFPLRAGTLLDGTGPATSRARLSGLLVGLEIAGSRDYWEGRPVVLIGAPGLTAPYRAALGAAGAVVTEEDGADMTLSGLRRAYEEFAQ